MLFRKRPKHTLPPLRRDRGASDAPGLHVIEYEMMLKGSINTRNGVSVRQFGVYVDGVIRLVTSGDCVDRETYEALLAAGAIKGTPHDEAGGADDAGTAQQTPLVVDDLTAE